MREKEKLKKWTGKNRLVKYFNTRKWDNSCLLYRALFHSCLILYGHALRLAVKYLIKEEREKEYDIREVKRVRKFDPMLAFQIRSVAWCFSGCGGLRAENVKKEKWWWVSPFRYSRWWIRLVFRLCLCFVWGFGWTHIRGVVSGFLLGTLSSALDTNARAFPDLWCTACFVQSRGNGKKCQGWN